MLALTTALHAKLLLAACVQTKIQALFRWELAKYGFDIGSNACKKLLFSPRVRSFRHTCLF